MDTIKYRDGYRYQLAETYGIMVDIQHKDTFDVNTEYVDLNCKGLLWIKAGYAWDGPSGPTKWICDRTPKWLRNWILKTILRGSLVHDALYQLIRQGYLNSFDDCIDYREKADKELKRICLEDGMSKIRAWWVYRGVRRFAKFAALPKNKKKILEAP